MFLRQTPIVLVAILALDACSGAVAPAAPAVSSASATPPATLASSAPTSSSAAMAPAATATPDSGNVDAPVTPGLSVETVGALGIRVTLADPAAKAWRVTVAGAVGDTADSWTLTVETGDVAPVITTVETVNGIVGEPQEQTGLETGDATGRICSVAVPACVRAGSVVLPHDGNGTLVLEISRTDIVTALDVTCATAGWPAEPFVLGPWTTTAPFPWGA